MRDSTFCGTVVGDSQMPGRYPLLEHVEVRRGLADRQACSYAVKYVLIVPAKVNAGDTLRER